MFSQIKLPGYPHNECTFQNPTAKVFERAENFDSMYGNEKKTSFQKLLVPRNIPLYAQNGYLAPLLLKICRKAEKFSLIPGQQQKKP